MPITLISGAATPTNTADYLIIGNAVMWRQTGRNMPELDGFGFADFRDLDGVLENATPSVILSSLTGPGFDAIDIAMKLQILGFKGRYRAIAAAVPKPELVVREVRERAPDVDFGIIRMSELQALSVNTP